LRSGVLIELRENREQKQDPHDKSLHGSSGSPGLPTRGAMDGETRGERDRRPPGAGGPADAGEHLVSPALVDRGAGLARLAAAASARPVVAVIEGEAGVGKTRLVEELLARPELSGSRRLVGWSRQIREPFPLGAVIEAVRGLGADLRQLALSPVAGALRPL